MSVVALSIVEILRLPVSAVSPLILTILPDILESRYIKLPSPSLYSSAVPFTEIESPALAREEVRSINPIEIYVYYI